MEFNCGHSNSNRGVSTRTPVGGHRSKSFTVCGGGGGGGYFKDLILHHGQFGLSRFYSLTFPDARPDIDGKP